MNESKTTNEWTDDEKRETFIKEVSDLAFGDETIERGYSMQERF